MIPSTRYSIPSIYSFIRGRGRNRELEHGSLPRAFNTIQILHGKWVENSHKNSTTATIIVAAVEKRARRMTQIIEQNGYSI